MLDRKFSVLTTCKRKRHTQTSFLDASKVYKYPFVKEEKPEMDVYHASLMFMKIEETAEKHLDLKLPK